MPTPFSHKFSSYYINQHFKNRWKRSINQLTKIQQENNLIIFDKKQKYINKIKLKMVNRLAQIDDEFVPLTKSQYKRKKLNNYHKDNQFILASTNHQTNNDLFTNFKLEQSIIYVQNPQNQQNNHKKSNKLHVYEYEQIFQQITQYNQSKYDQQIKMQCTKYQNKSIMKEFYNMLNINNNNQDLKKHKKLYKFCYKCDQPLTQKNNSTQINKDNTTQHKCHRPLTSFSNINNRLLQIQHYLHSFSPSNNLFNILLHNIIQLQLTIQQLIHNVNVLKQAVQYQFSPEEEIIRLRLLNIIGKKIVLIIKENQMEKVLESLMKQSLKSVKSLKQVTKKNKIN